MSASNAIGNFDLDSIQLRKPLSTSVVQSVSAGATPTLSVKDTTTGNSILMVPSTTGGAYNPLTVAGDEEIVAAGTVNAKSLTIGSWSSTTNGLRITPSTVTIGAGGTAAAPAQRIQFNNPASTLQLDYTNLGIVTGALPATSGAAAAAFLPVNINGVNYKIPLNTV